MAAIGPKLFLRLSIAIVVSSVLAVILAAQDREHELRTQIAQVATGLSAGNPTDALEPFSKSCADYEKLRTYFQGLTNSFDVANEAEVMSETDSATESKLTVNWSITLNGKEDEPGYQRSASLQIRFVREKNKWKIVELTPVSFFDPTAQ